MRKARSIKEIVVEMDCPYYMRVERKTSHISAFSQTQDRFAEQDAKELKRLRSEINALSRACRTFHLKLKRSERRSGRLQAQNEELSQEVEAVKSVRTGVAAEAEPTSRTEMLASAAIWSAVLLAGFHIVKNLKQ